MDFYNELSGIGDRQPRESLEMPSYAVDAPLGDAGVRASEPGFAGIMQNDNEYDISSGVNATSRESTASPDMPERQIAPPEPEPQYTVTAHKTVQNIQDAPGLLGEFTAGMTYDPVEVKYDVKKVDEPTEKPGTNYDRFSTPEPEMSFEEELDAKAKDFNEKQNADYERDMHSSPLYRGSFFNKYG